MSCVFQNIDPPLPLAFVAGGGHTRRVETGEKGGAGGQYFGRRKTQLFTLPISNHLWYSCYFLNNCEESIVV
jgi:hypothetical protein